MHTAFAHAAGKRDATGNEMNRFAGVRLSGLGQKRKNPARWHERCSYFRMKKIEKASVFTRFAQDAARSVGKPTASLLAFSTVIIWGVAGPWVRYDDTWQLVINTITSIVTFLMVFLIQNTQNRDSEAIHVKLDELIRIHAEANNKVLDLEELTQEELDILKNKYETLAEKARGKSARPRNSPGNSAM